MMGVPMTRDGGVVGRTIGRERVLVHMEAVESGENGLRLGCDGGCNCNSNG